jgi:acyl-ACP thioesterase
VQEVAEVTSSWCCLDAVSKRPARLARDITARFLPDGLLRRREGAKVPR